MIASSSRRPGNGQRTNTQAMSTPKYVVSRSLLNSSPSTVRAMCGFSPAAAANYLGADGDARDPLASPLFADLHGLPPLFINASTSEVLRDDAIRIAAKAQEQGVTVELSMKENLPHAYPGMCRALPEARATIRDVAVFLNRVG